MKKEIKDKTVFFDYEDLTGIVMNSQNKEMEIMKIMALFKNEFDDYLNKKEMEQELKKLRQFLEGCL
jgi:hypothetical protein